MRGSSDSSGPNASKNPQPAALSPSQAPAPSQPKANTPSPENSSRLTKSDPEKDDDHDDDDEDNEADAHAKNRVLLSEEPDDADQGRHLSSTRREPAGLAYSHVPSDTHPQRQARLGRGQSHATSGAHFPNSPETMSRPLLSTQTLARLMPGTRRYYSQLSSQPTQLGREKQQPQQPRVQKVDFLDESASDGSLWASTGQTNYYFTKNRILSRGDLVTLVLEGELLQAIGHEIESTLSPREKELEWEQAGFREASLNLLKNAGRQKAQDQLKTTSSAPLAASPSPTSDTGGSSEAKPSSSAGAGATTEEQAFAGETSSSNSVNIFSSLNLKKGDLMMAEILDRYPNGNYKMRAFKKVAYKNGPPRVVMILGLLQAGEINEENNFIKSSKLYDYRVEISH